MMALVIWLLMVKRNGIFSCWVIFLTELSRENVGS